MNQEITEFFSICSCDACKGFSLFLELDKKQQEEIFFSVRTELDNDKEEVLKDYPCWRLLETLIQFIYNSV